MDVKNYFFDTYAFYEVIKGNESYKQFSRIGIVTTRLQLMELYYCLLTSHGKKVAEKYFDLLKKYTIDFSDDALKEAMVFRSLNKKKKLSYVDCIGYIIANRMQIPFLTGDKEFEEMSNVLFVK